MDFRRSAARRRRVMREDVLDVERSAGTSTSTASPFQRYNTDEVLRLQPMMLDWLPKRSWTNLLVSSLILMMTVAIVGIHYQPVDMADQAVDSPALSSQWNSLLSLKDSSSLGHLFWTTVGLTSVVLVYQLFLLRRHREDDYLGNYQVWLWALPYAIVVAIASVPSFRLAANLVVETTLTGQQALLAKGVLYSVIAGWTLVLATRLVMEVKESKVAVVALVASALVAVSTLLIQACVYFQFPLGPIGKLPSDLPMALGFVATVGWAVSLLSYLGFVCRDVIGLISHEASQQVDEELSDRQSKKATKRKEPAKDELTPKNSKRVKEQTQKKSVDVAEEALADASESETDAPVRRSRRRNRRQAA